MESEQKDKIVTWQDVEVKSLHEEKNDPLLERAREIALHCKHYMNQSIYKRES